MWVPVGQGKHPGCADPPHCYAGHWNAGQRRGVAVQQASQHRGGLSAMSPATATGKGKGQNSRQKVTGQEKWLRLCLGDRGRKEFWVHPFSG